MISKQIKTVEKEWGAAWRETLASCIVKETKWDVSFKNDCLPVKEPVGLGDVVASLANPIAKVINKALGTNIGSDKPGCGCKKRKEALNKLVPDIKKVFSAD